MDQDSYCSLCPPDAALPGRCQFCGELLPPKRRRYCTDACGRSYADQHSWVYARQAALERDGFRCVRCGSDFGLEVHHDPKLADGESYANGCQHHLDRLVTLCAIHHLVEHRWIREGKPPRQLELALSA